jgi:hypothetical protein
MKYQLQLARIFFAMSLIFFCTSHAQAVGLGFSVGTGSEEWENDVYNNGNREVSNVGFVVDTAVARNKVFNYRFTFLKEENNADGGNLDMQGYAMTHDFGFGVVRTKNVRLWLGPELKASYYEDLTQNNGRTTTGDVVGFGAGPVIGLNVNLPQVVSFTFTAAYHIIGFYAGGDSYYDSNTGTYVDTVDADSNGLYLNIGVIFRINE